MSLTALFIVFGLAALGGTLASLRREHIRTEYSVSWLVVGGILAVLGLFPGLLGGLATWTGADPRMLLLIAAGVLVSGLVFEISHVVSRLRDENVVMAQRLAILEYRLRGIDRGDGKGE